MLKISAKSGKTGGEKVYNMKKSTFLQLDKCGKITFILELVCKLRWKSDFSAVEYKRKEGALSWITKIPRKS